jgi:hypothetical protein
LQRQTYTTPQQRHQTATPTTANSKQLNTNQLQHQTTHTIKHTKQNQLHQTTTPPNTKATHNTNNNTVPNTKQQHKLLHQNNTKHQPQQHEKGRTNKEI